MFNAEVQSEAITALIPPTHPATVWVHAVQCDIPMRGNISAVNDAVDAAVEEDAQWQLENGNVWMWADVRVTVMDGYVEGVAHIGACSYADCRDFLQSDTFRDVLHEAWEAYQEEVEFTRHHVNVRLSGFHTSR